uniref:Mannose-binding protein A-like n=1 Tax=Ciona intestinalis TaxID=7719 RepID=F6PNN6_CIOIN|nr:mannose-binding protein A-like [Ciona intestinalis]|eukprot:XP_002129962.1 mannose-binding protein A-like [Ciona intestinalis]
MFSFKVCVVFIIGLHAAVYAGDNIYLTCSESGPPLEGNQGPPGPAGPAGPKGPKGDTGVTTELEHTVHNLEKRLQKAERDIVVMTKTINEINSHTCQCMEVIDGKVWYGPGNGYLYLIIVSDMTYDEARSKCSKYGATLAVHGPKNRDVMKILHKQLPVTTQEDYWIGLTDKQSEGRFVWEDGSALKSSEANWYPGEPTDYEHNEDCVGGNFRDSLQWNDYKCSDGQLYALCERRE